MFHNIKPAFNAFLHQYTAFRGRGFAFRLFTLLAVATSVLIIAGGIYRQFNPKQKETYPTALTTTFSKQLN